MRRLCIIALAVSVLALLLMGMEGLGGSDEKFPEPELNYGATVTDLDGVVHKIQKASVNGETALSGFHGKASLTINFRRIAKVEISKGETKTYVYAHITLRDGKELNLKVKGLTRCYGETELGNMSVRMRDIKSIVFDETLPEPEK